MTGPILSVSKVENNSWSGLDYIETGAGVVAGGWVGESYIHTNIINVFDGSANNA